MPDKMRAARLVEVGHMVCEDAVVRPPDADEVVVRNSYASICGSDLHTIFFGTSVQPLPLAPGAPGHEGIGEVVESRHPDFAAGDQVLTAPPGAYFRTFAEYQTIPGRSCIKLEPGPVPALELLMGQQLGTVIFALRRNPVDVTGKNVVVMGQGSAGLFFTHFMRQRGARQIITADRSPARLAVSRKMGAHVAVNVDEDNLVEAVMDATGGTGADFLVEAVGRSESFLQSVDLMAMDARILWFGIPDTHEPISFNWTGFFRRRLTGWSMVGSQGEEDLVSFRLAVDLIQRGAIDVGDIVSHVLSLEEIDEAVHLAHERTDNALKVSIRF